MLVHAGLLPQWDVASAERYARDVEAQLRGSERSALLSAFSAPCPAEMPTEEHRAARGAFVLHALTRLRVCTAAGRMNLAYSGSLEGLPPDHYAWFQAPKRQWTDHRVVVGHWAALDLHLSDGIMALDTGCVWGRALTAVRLDDDQVFQEPCADTL